MNKLLWLLAGFFVFIIIAANSSRGNPRPDSSKQYIMIGHAHIDPVWRWTRDEGYQEVFATFRSALDRMKEFSDVSFVASSAQFYKWVAEEDPAMFEEIKARVKEGRWNIVGGWWIEPDVNCPSGESLVRQGLYGQQFFQQHFGVKARVGFNPDTFGHPWNLPQILRQQELDSYFFMRPEKHEKPNLPAPIFYWQGEDGSKILAVQIIGAYSGRAHDIEGRTKQYVDRFAQDLPNIDEYALFYGVGNHGGGPTIDTIEKIHQLRGEKFPGMKLGSAEDYIGMIRPFSDSFPIVNDELQHHARGCYSACSDVKMWNRQAEAALISTEKISAFATAKLGNAYPAEALRDAWEKTLFNQFHDILAGSSIEQAYVEARNDYGYVQSVTKKIATSALHQLAASASTADVKYPQSVPFIVFNLCSFPVNVPVEIEIQRPVRGVTPVLRDEKGDPLSYQEIRTAAVKINNERIRVLFQVVLPGLGYRIYRLDFNQQELTAAKPGVAVGEWFLENDMAKVLFDAKTGYISSYFDKKNKRELLSGPAAVPIVLDDWDDTWGHKIIAYDKEIGRFAKPKFRIMETGPERGRIQVEYSFGNSRITQDFALCRDSQDLSCRVTTDWYEHSRVLKMGFSTILKTGRLTFSIPYGFIERPQTGDEEPGQTWIDLSGSDKSGAFGIALLNDGKCGYSVKNGEMRVTVLHSTAWCHHNPAVVSDEDGYRYMEQGRHEFTYRLVPHNGDWRQGRIPQEAESFLLSPVSLLTTNHQGKLPLSDSLLSVTPPNVAVTAMKLSEDGKAFVLRCVEQYGEKASGRIDSPFLGGAIQFNLRPCEIKSFRLPLNRQEPSVEVNLLESPVSQAVH